MQLFDRGGQLTARPTPNPTINPGWANNDLTQSTAPTLGDPDWANALTAEFESVLAASGQTFSKTNVAQLLQGIQTLGGAVVGSMRRLIGSAAGGTQTASWTVRELIVETALAGQAYKGANLALAFNGAATGAGGMDTGAMPVSADLSIYAIFNPTTATWSTLGCAGGTSNGDAYTGAHMPSGYTASALIYAGVTDGSGNIVQFEQVGRTIHPYRSYFATGLSSTTLTSLSLSATIPANATEWAPEITQTSGTAGTTSMGIYYSNGNVALGGSTGGQTTVLNAGLFSPAMPIVTPQLVYYQLVGAAAAFSLATASYTF